MNPGPDEVLALRDVVCPEGVEEDPGPIVVGDGACPGGCVPQFFSRFKAEEEIYGIHFYGIFHFDRHLGVVLLANAVEDFALGDRNGFKATYRFVGSGCKKRRRSIRTDQDEGRESGDNADQGDSTARCGCGCARWSKCTGGRRCCGWTGCRCVGWRQAGEKIQNRAGLQQKHCGNDEN